MKIYQQDNELTDWFSCATPPVREGVYEVDNQYNWPASSWFAYWDGKQFGYRCLSADRAYNNRFNYAGNPPPVLNWRGMRRWVLTAPDHPLIGDDFVYITNISKRGVLRTVAELYNPAFKVSAMGFNTEADAIAYAMKNKRHLRDGWKVVLP